MSAVTLPAWNLGKASQGATLSAWIPIGTSATMPWLIPMARGRATRTTDYSAISAFMVPAFEVVGANGGLYGLRRTHFSQSNIVWITEPGREWVKNYWITVGPADSGVLFLTADSAGLYRAYISDFPMPSSQGGSATLRFTGGGNTYTLPLVLDGTLPPPVVTPIADIAALVGQRVSFTVTATNSPTSFNATGLPPGIARVTGGSPAVLGTPDGSPPGNLGAAWAGEPTTAGTYTVTASATNAGGTGSTSFRIAVSEVVGGRSWWAARIAGRLRRAIWADRFLELRNNIWHRCNYNQTTMVVSSSAPVVATDFTEAEFRALDWVTSDLPGTAAEAGGNNWRWAREAARAGRQVARAAWSRRYLEMAAGGLWYAVWTGSTGGVTTRRVAAAGDITPEDFRARDWRSVGGTGTEPTPDDDAVIG